MKKATKQKIKKIITYALCALALVGVSKKLHFFCEFLSIYLAQSILFRYNSSMRASARHMGIARHASEVTHGTDLHHTRQRGV